MQGFTISTIIEINDFKQSFLYNLYPSLFQRRTKQYNLKHIPVITVKECHHQNAFNHRLFYHHIHSALSFLKPQIVHDAVKPLEIDSQDICTKMQSLISLVRIAPNISVQIDSTSVHLVFHR